MRKVLVPMLICACGASAEGSDGTPKSVPSRVPDDRLRPFAADRPNRTFSATTIDVGRVQIESDLANVVFDRSERTRTFSLGSPVLRYGITDNAEIQVGLNAFTRLKRGVTDEATGETIRGRGTSFIASKINLFGNDGGGSAMALVGTLRLPTASRGLGAEHVEASLDLPFTTPLGSPHWRLTLQPHLSLLRNDLGTAHRGHYGMAAQLEYALSATVTLGVEVATYLWRDPGFLSSSSLDLSLGWMLFENTQLDVAVHIGLDARTPSANPYLGISHRF
jgi:hypothetical protein